ncbi:locomotion-related protein Hikaru genki isoform X2 [Planococcus citri]|uniref:locomotion-related protein Hikaru genki isoform X2 n=1 Tax=Planococcus citri TaxID=170843 RepID=UPI0031FA01AD
MALADDSSPNTKITIAVAVATTFIICVHANANASQPGTSRAAAAAATSGCPTPSLTLNGHPVVARRNSSPDYSTLGEIKFTARMSSPFVGAKLQHRVCKIKCVAGEWVGPLCKIEQNNEDDGRFHPILRSCKLHLDGTNLALIYDGALLQRWNGHVPDRSKVTIRCDGAPGLYKLHGTSNLQCLDGDWDREIPRCLPTTSISAYSQHSPPTIRVKLAFGDSAIDYRNNHVVIYPGSIVHLECLFRRRYGDDVRWSRTTSTTIAQTKTMQQQQQQQQRDHLTGWSIAADEREWIYRMSLYYVKSEHDSGNYTCITPTNQNNTVTLRVEAIQCEKRSADENRRNITISNWKARGNHVGQTVEYACAHGFTLVGSNRSTCLADGKWSSNVPFCEPIVCASGSIADVHLIASGTNNTYGSSIGFRCAWGYALKGANEIRCKIDGQWSSPVPKCVDILCAPPSIPANGYLLEKSDDANANYRVGTVIQFACEKPYRITGEESIICEENGVWSSASPDCRMVCEHPGEPANGRLAPSKFWYETGDGVRVICDAGYAVIESEALRRLSCTAHGTWSTEIPRCVNSTRIIETTDPTNGSLTLTPTPANPSTSRGER